MHSTFEEAIGEEEKRCATRYTGILLSVGIMGAVATWHCVHSSLALKVCRRREPCAMSIRRQYPGIYEHETVKSFKRSSTSLWQSEDIGLLMMLGLMIWAVAVAVLHPELFLRYFAKGEGLDADEEQLEEGDTKESEWYLR